MPGPTGRKRVLMMPLSIYGQVACHLAVAHELLQRGVEVHFATFKVREATTADVSQEALKDAPEGTPPIKFHAIGGAEDGDMGDDAPWPDDFVDDRISMWTSIRQNRWIIMGTTSQWPEDNFFALYRSCLDIIKRVDADIVAVDSLFGPAYAACQHTPSLKYTILSPNTIKDYSGVVQPYLRGLWKVPVMSTGFSFPVPWSQILANLFHFGVFIYYTITDSTARSIRARMKAETGRTFFTLADTCISRPEGIQVLVANCPEIEFQPWYMPSDIVPCGPIIRPVHPIDERDPELLSWLARGPTIMFNLGTLFEWKEDLAIETALSLRHALRSTSDDPKLRNLQVLWKLKRNQKQPFSVDEGSAIHGILGDDINSGRVKIVSWLAASPLSVLESGHVILSVNHGGANSWNEAVCAGVPQVVLPAWLDCFDFAARTESLGIGLQGNKELLPKWTASELGPKLVAAIRGPAAENYQSKAKELSDICTRGPRGVGRAYAANYILNMI